MLQGYVPQPSEIRNPTELYFAPRRPDPAVPWLRRRVCDLVGMRRVCQGDFLSDPKSIQASAQFVQGSLRAIPAATLNDVGIHVAGAKGFGQGNHSLVPGLTKNDFVVPVDACNIDAYWLAGNRLGLIILRGKKQMVADVERLKK